MHIFSHALDFVPTVQQNTLHATNQPASLLTYLLHGAESGWDGFLIGSLDME
jgi:hypothetical protein